MSTKTTGQVMLFGAFALGMGLMTLYFAEMERRQFNPNDDPETFTYANRVEVPLKRNRYGHYVVTGTINGVEVEFLLDTGATDVVVPQDTADMIGLPYGEPGEAATANGTILVYDTTLDSLAIGDIRLHEVNASINPSMEEGAVLLGMSALGKVEFTHSGNTLTLRQTGR